MQHCPKTMNHCVIKSVDKETENEQLNIQAMNAVLTMVGKDDQAVANLQRQQGTVSGVLTEELYEKVHDILNKLTPRNFQILIDEIKNLSIDTVGHLQGIADIVFEKAVDEPNFSCGYALVCRELALIQVPANAEGKQKDKTDSVNFRKLLANKCQQEFDKNLFDESTRNQKIREIEKCSDTKKQQELQLELEDYDRCIRQKSLSNMRFIGELYKQHMLTANIMERCLTILLQNQDEESIEYLCKLLISVDKELEAAKCDFNSFFITMKKIVNKKHWRISKRVQLILQDVIDLHNDKSLMGKFCNLTPFTAQGNNLGRELNTKTALIPPQTLPILVGSINVLVTDTELPELSYKSDQWSPLNQDGKKIYDKDFLMSLRYYPMCIKRPDNIPTGLVPENKAPTTKKKNSSKGGAVASKRNSQQGKVNQASAQEEVKLHECANPWKPKRLNSGDVLTGDDKTTDELYKNVRCILNKLTLQKFEILLSQINKFTIDTIGRLQGVVDLVLNKAVDEPIFTFIYALLCKELAFIKVPITGGGEQNFRELLANRCLQEFKKNSFDDSRRNQKVEEIRDCSVSEKKKKLLLELEDYDWRSRQKFIGNIRFIGELFKQHLLAANVVELYLTDLMQNKDEKSLECLSILLSSVGKELEATKRDLNGFFTIMKEIVDKKQKLGHRVRFMLQDVIDLRNSSWIPCRQDLNAMTMDQIQKKAENGQLDIQAMNSVPTSLRKNNRANAVPNSDGKRLNATDGRLMSTFYSRTPIVDQRDKLKSKTLLFDEAITSTKTAPTVPSNSVTLKNIDTKTAPMTPQTLPTLVHPINSLVIDTELSCNNETNTKTSIENNDSTDEIKPSELPYNSGSVDAFTKSFILQPQQSQRNNQGSTLRAMGAMGPPAPANADLKLQQIPQHLSPVKQEGIGLVPFHSQSYVMMVPQSKFTQPFVPPEQQNQWSNHSPILRDMGPTRPQTQTTQHLGLVKQEGGIYLVPPSHPQPYLIMVPQSKSAHPFVPQNQQSQWNNQSPTLRGPGATEPSTPPSTDLKVQQIPQHLDAIIQEAISRVPFHPQSYVMMVPQSKFTQSFVSPEQQSQENNQSPTLRGPTGPPTQPLTPPSTDLKVQQIPQHLDAIIQDAISLVPFHPQSYVMMVPQSKFTQLFAPPEQQSQENNQSPTLRGPTGPPTQLLTPPNTDLKVQQIPQQTSTNLAHIPQSQLKGAALSYYSRSPALSSVTPRMPGGLGQVQPMYPMQTPHFVPMVRPPIYPMYQNMPHFNNAGPWLQTGFRPTFHMIANQQIAYSNPNMPYFYNQQIGMSQPEPLNNMRPPPTMMSISPTVKQEQNMITNEYEGMVQVSPITETTTKKNKLNDSFIAWRTNNSLAEQEAKRVALKQLESFFTQQKKAETESGSTTSDESSSTTSDESSSMASDEI